MSILLESLRLHLPLPADFRWQQVKPMSASRSGAPRLSWPAGLPGVGDESTWPAYTGHPNDPRAPDGPEHAATLDAMSDAIGLLEQARAEVKRTDDWTDAAARLVREAIETLQALECEP